MLIIKNTNTDPYFNFACEEYFFLARSEEVFRVWQTEPTISIGVNQNAMSQINSEYVIQNNIKIVRRTTGGGAVYHDLGSMNFTFIENQTVGDISDSATLSSQSSGETNFAKYIERIVEFLKTLGLSAKFEGRNDIVIDGLKISGNSEIIKNGRILHHGTLLFDTDLETVGKALSVSKEKYQDKSVDSIRKRVANIRDFLGEKLTVNSFISELIQYFTVAGKDTTNYDLTVEDIAAINDLVNKKYSTWEWNIGKSPKYNFHKIEKTKGGIVEVFLDVDSGIIKDISIRGDFFNLKDISLIENFLIGKNHSIIEIETALSENFIIEDFFVNISLQELLNCLH